jgi:hypothetical protein
MSDNTTNTIETSEQDKLKTTKKLSHSKLQVANEELQSRIKNYESIVIGHLQKIELLTKENQSFMTTIENQKKEIHQLTTNMNDILGNFNNHKVLTIQEKTTWANTRAHLENCFNQLNDTHKELQEKHTTSTQMLSDVKKNEQDISHRYQSLTLLYSKQTAELTLLKKELNNINEELKHQTTNHKKTIDELALVKREVNLKNISTSYSYRQQGLGLPVQINSPINLSPTINLPPTSNLVSLPKPKVNISSNERGIKISTRR